MTATSIFKKFSSFPHFSWYKNPESYAPFSLQWIYVFKAILTSFLLLLIIFYWNLPAGSSLMCAAPLFMMSGDRSLVKDMFWQVPSGFVIGILFGLLGLNLIGLYWPIALLMMAFWNAAWIYLSSLKDYLNIPCRIISITPLILFNMAGFGQINLIPSAIEILLGLSFLGIWGFVLIDHLVFPIKNNFPKNKIKINLNIKNFNLDFLKFDWGYFILALQTMLSVLFILLIAYLTNFPGISFITPAIISCVVIATPSSIKLKSNLSNRIIGAVFGGLLGILFVFLINQCPLTWLMISSFIVSIGIIAYLAQIHMRFMSMGLQAGFAFIAITAPGIESTGDINAGLIRLGGIFYGCAVSYFMAYGLSFLLKQKSSGDPL